MTQKNFSPNLGYPSHFNNPLPIPFNIFSPYNQYPNLFNNENIQRLGGYQDYLTVTEPKVSINNNEKPGKKREKCLGEKNKQDSSEDENNYNSQDNIEEMVYVYRAENSENEILFSRVIFYFRMLA